jgi:hypothetical protein
MTIVATVLYEDKMQVGSGGAYPFHDLVLSMVADETHYTLWELRERIDKNPRNGVSKLISDLGMTGALAGAGWLYILVDRDRIAEHVGLPRLAPEADVTAALKARSDAPDKLRVFYLEPNMEGLLHAVATCEPTLSAPLAKDHMARDLRLNKVVHWSNRALRDCVRGHQPGLNELVVALAGLV